jgi:hypothetical protein
MKESMKYIRTRADNKALLKTLRQNLVSDGRPQLTPLEKVGYTLYMIGMICLAVTMVIGFAK